MLRNVLVAPLTEEFVFRACMAPLLLARVRDHFIQATRRRAGLSFTANKAGLQPRRKQVSSWLQLCSTWSAPGCLCKDTASIQLPPGCLCHVCACAQGHSEMTTVLLTPLFFGLAHLHHLREHVVHQGHTLRLAATMVRRVCAVLCQDIMQVQGLFSDGPAGPCMHAECGGS